MALALVWPKMNEKENEKRTKKEERTKIYQSIYDIQMKNCTVCTVQLTDSMNVFELNPADFFGGRMLKNYLMAEFRLAFDAFFYFVFLLIIAFAVGLSFCCWTVAGVLKSKKLKVFLNESIITSFYLVHPLPYYPLCTRLRLHAYV